VQPSWVQTAEYAKTPVLVRKRTAGVPALETKVCVAPTLKAASLTIFLTVEFSPVATAAADDFGNSFPTPAPAIAMAATVETRKNPRLSRATLLLRRDPYRKRN